MINGSKHSTRPPKTHVCTRNDTITTVLQEIENVLKDDAAHPFGVPTDGQATVQGRSDSKLFGGHQKENAERTQSFNNTPTLSQCTVDVAEARRQRMSKLENDESAKTRKKRKAWYYPTLHWGLSSNVDTRQDGAVALQAWDLIIAFSCLYQGFMVPFSLCFEKLYLPHGSDNDSEQCLFSPSVSIHPSAPFFVTRYLDIVVDLFFILDICLNDWLLEA